MTTPSAAGPADQGEVTFRIGTASRMTGIPVDTLRVWERRYGVVTPLRSPGADRLYRQDDIKRLALLKKLVDRGHAIGTIARLPDQKLAEQLQAYDEQVLTDKKTMTNQKPVRVAVLGDVLVHRIRNEAVEPGLKVVGLHKSRLEFETTIAEKPVDAIIPEFAKAGATYIRQSIMTASATFAGWPGNPAPGMFSLFTDSPAARCWNHLAPTNSPCCRHR